MQPQLPIDVDPQTGVWTTDALPMIYVPRHFFTNNHAAVEQALGREAYAEILYPAGYKSAYFWCDKESGQHGIDGMAVFEHYLNRLSQRGWGQFRIVESDPSKASARIELRHSSFVLAQPGVEGKLCYMFAGWFAGAMDWVIDQMDIPANSGESANGGAGGCSKPLRSMSRETQCASEGYDHCVFEVSAL